MRSMAGYIGNKEMISGMKNGIRLLQESGSSMRYINTQFNIIGVAAHQLRAAVTAK